MSLDYSSFSSVLQEKLLLSRNRFPNNVGACSNEGLTQAMTSRQEKPYADQGKRLRKRRRELQETKKIGELKEYAKSLSVSVSAILQWERGETWPTAKKKGRLATLLGWTVQELDYGHAPLIREGQEMLHPVSTQEMVLLALFRVLGPEQREDEIERLKSETMATQAIQKELRGEIRHVPDAKVEKHFRSPKKTVK